MKVKKLSGQEVLEHLIDLLSYYLKDLSNLSRGIDNKNFTDGLKTAYVECLEIIQMWEGAKEHGLDWNIEEKFPV